jgi:hypothetical protein
MRVVADFHLHVRSRSNGLDHGLVHLAFFHDLNTIRRLSDEICSRR